MEHGCSEEEAVGGHNQARASVRIAQHSLSPSRPDQCPYFLSLPPEIRADILRRAILDAKDLSPLLVCRLLERESRAMLYHKPVRFRSQADLLEWTRRSSETNLMKVTNLTIQLTDIDLSPIMTEPAVGDTTPVTAWNLYQQETVNLQEAFSRLPSLSRITLLTPKKVQPQLLRVFYISVLQLIGAQYENLESFTVHDDDAILSSAPALQRLPTIQWVRGRSPIEGASKGLAT